MAGVGPRWLGCSSRLMGATLFGFVGLASLVVVLADASSELEGYGGVGPENDESGYLMMNFPRLKGELGYTHVWPEMEFGWQIVVGTVIGFCGAAFGSVGGVGGGGIYVPMLALIIGFDDKSSIAISKCMITGAAGATVYSNLKLRHPTLDMPIIDYDLALLFQPMLVLGISIGVAFNVIFADWMITVLLIVLFLGTSTKAFLKGVEMWKKETIVKKEAARRLAGDDNEQVVYEPLPGGPSDVEGSETNGSRKEEVSILENVYWMELGLLFAVWLMVLVLQIAKNETTTCSVAYWVLNLLQFPVAIVVSGYEAMSLYKGRRRIQSKGDAGTNLQVHQLFLYCGCGVLAGIVGGLLGLGGGFILGPLFLELGVPPQVSSATATFAMTFSASMSVVEYYLLNRFPVPYGELPNTQRDTNPATWGLKICILGVVAALYFVFVAVVAAFTGQYIVGKLIRKLGRASLIVFILSLTIFVSAISLGGVGIANVITEMENHDYMGFDNICSYQT